ncbi:MAG: permease prefix domain 1-containing protein [Planctomycetota bacterium]|nr:permease prefix domain 1-containing protein [Planctomycetota bacterium]MDA1179772.1 permease prefix domain 1-containing protein [Planctomycetota bacterium]
MTDEQFQNYLALLKGLLKLSNRERDAIADELQQHMDERLAELLQAKVPHDEAVRCSLEEFGDAAGVAQRFLQVDHFKRRRRIMRMTFGSFAILSVLALALMLLPQDNLHQSLVAQRGGDTQSDVNSSANGVEYLGF